jgi:hypothetical protein
MTSSIQGIAPTLIFANLARMIQAGVEKAQWSIYASEVFRILKPSNGYIQCSEWDPLLHCDDNTVPKDAAFWRVSSIN